MLSGPGLGFTDPKAPPGPGEHAVALSLIRLNTLAFLGLIFLWPQALRAGPTPTLDSWLRVPAALSGTSDWMARAGEATLRSDPLAVQVRRAQAQMPQNTWWRWGLVVLGAGLLGGAFWTGRGKGRVTTLPHRRTRRFRVPTGRLQGGPGGHGAEQVNEWTSVRTGRTVPIPSGMIEDETVRYYAPPAGTLKILGPWFDIERPTNQAIRLFSLPNVSGATEITFGRKPGPPYSHIQIKKATVSGHQATIRLHTNRAELLNLSRTNPTQLNGNPVHSGPVELSDGDGIDLGGVLLRFHARPPAESE